jgi:hypothetical protein
MWLRIFRYPEWSLLTKPESLNARCARVSEPAPWARYEFFGTPPRQQFCPRLVLPKTEGPLESERPNATDQGLRTVA